VNSLSQTAPPQGKSDPIDAHLAVLAALRLDADRLPMPRADGDREALRILLGARQEITAASTGQTNRLRALLLAGDDTDRVVARGALTETLLAGLARRRLHADAGRDQAVRHAEIRRLTLALQPAREQLDVQSPTADRGGQDPTGDSPPLEALHRPRALPTTHGSMQPVNRP
jgi:hypothetical protein